MGLWESLWLIPVWQGKDFFQARTHSHSADVITHKALRGVIHDAQLETLLILKRLCESTTKRIGRQHLLTAALKLVKDTLIWEGGERKNRICRWKDPCAHK